MPLSKPVSRQLRHRRVINVEVFERDDGLWDVEARLTDLKTRDLQLAQGVRPQGLPLHELWLRLVVDAQLNVVDAEACSEWVPYPGVCDTVAPAYRKLIGLNLLRGFRRNAIERLGGVQGCTHLTELCALLPTVAIQTFNSEVWSVGVQNDDVMPFALDRCQALRLDGPAVQQFYPRWYGHAPRDPLSAGAGPAVPNSSNTTQTEGIRHEDSRVSG